MFAVRVCGGCVFLGVEMYEFAVGFFRRLRGLIGNEDAYTNGTQLVFVGCDSIHTFFMRACIDVAFADASGQVLRTKVGLEPGHVVRCRGASVAVERISQQDSGDAAWYRPGDYLALVRSGIPFYVGLSSCVNESYRHVNMCAKCE